MALTLNSPGVFLNENDTSQVTTGPISVGAALVGPTVKGPVNTPTVVTTYSQYKSIFGATFSDANGNTQEYLNSIAAYNYFQQGGTSLLVTRVVTGVYAPAEAYVESIATTGSLTGTISNVITGITASTSFVLETLSQGSIMNLTLTSPVVSASFNGAARTLNFVGLSGDVSASLSASFNGPSGSLVSGSADNVRWEITAADVTSGQFSLSIRQGNDYDNKKTVLETWSNLSLDPNSPNYIEYVIGNQASQITLNPSTGEWYLKTDGSYVNNSKYVRVKSVAKPTPNYLDALGQPKNEFTASIPAVGSGILKGAFVSAQGSVSTTVTGSMFDQIPQVAGVPIQGVLALDYTSSIGLLSNKDSYQYNVIYTPGLTLQNAPSVVATMISNTQDRGDAIAVVDTVAYNTTNISTRKLVG
jgi:hypothetical protein